MTPLPPHPLAQLVLRCSPPPEPTLQYGHSIYGATSPVYPAAPPPPARRFHQQFRIGDLRFAQLLTHQSDKQHRDFQDVGEGPLKGKQHVLNDLLADRAEESGKELGGAKDRA